MSITSDGSTASYYELPEGAKELQDLISHRNMNAQDGEIFRAIYRKGMASHSDELRDAKKVLFYAQAEVKRLEKKATTIHHRVAELVQEIKDRIAEDEPAWRHWRVGDIVACIEGEGWLKFETGGLYPVTDTGGDYVEIAGTQVRRFTDDFKFHSRPSK